MTKRSPKAERRRPRTETPPPESEKAPTRRRWPWFLVGGLALLYFLPTIVVMTPLKRTAINWALSDFDGAVEVDTVSAGWFSPIVLNGVSASDPAGKPLLSVSKVTTERSLVGLATGGSDLGRVELSSPEVFLQLRPDGSNLEDAIATYLQPSDEPSSPLPHVQLAVTGAQVHLTSSTDPEEWLINNLNLNAEIAGEHEALQAELAATVQSKNHPEGGLQLKVQLDPGSQSLLVNSGVAEINASGFPVAVLVPLAQRWLGPCNAIGEIDGNCTVQFADGGGQMASTLNRIELTQFGVVAPRYLKQDQVSLNRLLLDGRLELSGNGIEAEQFKAESEIGSITTDGQVDLADLSTLMNGEIPDKPFNAHGELDLPGIAAMLPETLSLHEDLQVQSGTVTFDASTRHDGGVNRLIVDLGAANLTAQRGQQLLNWHQPLRLTARIGQSESQWVLEQIKCESDFLQLEGKADRQVGSFTANGDLELLRKNLSQFVDLTGIELAGKLSGEFGWSFRENQQPDQGLHERPVQIGGKFAIEQPVLQLPGTQRWSAPHLSVICNAAGKRTPDGVIRINGGGARAVIDQEILTARLAQPIEDVAVAKSAELTWDAKGRLDGWLGLIRNLMWFGDFDASGRMEANGTALVSLDKIQVTELNYSVAGLRFDGYGAQFVEKEVTGTGKLSYNLNNGLIYIPAMNLASSSLSARGQKIKMTIGDHIDVTGDVVFSADMNRLTHWYDLSPDADSVNWFGTAQGTVALSSDANLIYGQLEGVIKDLVAAQRSQPAVVTNPNANSPVPVQNASHTNAWTELMREKDVRITSQIGVAQDFDSVQFANAQLVASAVQVSGAGSIRDLAQSWQTEFEGEWDPVWEKVNGLLNAYTYDSVQLRGSGRQPFRVTGPIFAQTAWEDQWFPPELQIQTRFGWDSGQLLQLAIGGSEMTVDVNQSVVFVDTGSVALVEGTVRAKPMIDLRQEEPVLIMEKGQVVDQINLSSEICRDFLKYVTPLVADATAAQGKLSVFQDGVQFPVYNPSAAQANGVIQLHEGTIGAGPLAKQIFDTVSQVKQLLKPGSSLGNQSMVWMQLGDQEIPFAIQNGRVYHKGIRMKIDDVVIQTEGYVGMDQTLNLVAHIPIADDWLGDNRWLAGLRGQSLQIPITGTISQPKLDRQAIQKLSRQLVQQTAGNAFNNLVQEKTGDLQNKLGDELNRAQEKLNDKIGNELQKGLKDLFNRDK